MIAFISGKVVAMDEDCLVLERDGLGITVSAPMSRLHPRPAIGDSLTLHTHLQVREDAWVLYGFTDQDQLYVFRLLLAVSGVGAKTALAIVDGVNTRRFAEAIANKDIKALTAISGVGKKTAERIILELKDKFSQLVFDEATQELSAIEAAEGPELNQDLVAALKQLGYSATEARAFTLAAQGVLGTEATAEALLREALKAARTA